MTEHVKRLWAGALPLHEAFWHYAIVFGLLVNIATITLFLGLYVADADTTLLVAAFLLPVPYNLLVGVAVWRSADRYQGPQRWADLARAASLVWLLVLTAA